MSNIVYSTKLAGAKNLHEICLETKRREAKATVDQFILDSCYSSWEEYLADTQEDFMDAWREKELEEEMDSLMSEEMLAQEEEFLYDEALVEDSMLASLNN